MFVPIWTPEGEDEGYLNLDTLDRFKMEYSPGNPDTFNLIAKKGSITKVWQISGNSYQSIKAHMGQHGF